jgi:heat shock protein HslJ
MDARFWIACGLVAGTLCGCAAVGEKPDADADIREKYWKLVELRGAPVPRLEREPHLILKADGNRVNGFGGCNSLTGAYVLDAKASRIRFEQLVTTLRACAEGMDTEQAFTEILGSVDNFSLDGDRLTLNRARMAPLARFEAVYLR